MNCSHRYWRRGQSHDNFKTCVACGEIRMMENETQLEDSHTAETFGDTKQALRYDDGKPEMHYILTFPNAMREFAKVCTYGGKKYDVGNYLKGAPHSQYVKCGLRHLFAWWNGEERDPESGCLHLAHFVWNALCLCEMAISRKDLDDRFNQETVKERKDD